MDVADIFRYPLLHELASATIHLQHTVHDQEVTPFSLWRDKTDVESVVKAFLPLMALNQLPYKTYTRAHRSRKASYHCPLRVAETM